MLVLMTSNENLQYCCAKYVLKTNIKTQEVYFFPLSSMCALFTFLPPKTIENYSNMINLFNKGKMSSCHKWPILILYNIKLQKPQLLLPTNGILIIKAFIST